MAYAYLCTVYILYLSHQQSNPSPLPHCEVQDFSTSLSNCCCVCVRVCVCETNTFNVRQQRSEKKGILDRHIILPVSFIAEYLVTDAAHR